jgi:hypothetical protein
MVEVVDLADPSERLLHHTGRARALFARMGTLLASGDARPEDFARLFEESGTSFPGR